MDCTYDIPRGNTAKEALAEFLTLTRGVKNLCRSVLTDQRDTIYWLGEDRDSDQVSFAAAIPPSCAKNRAVAVSMNVNVVQDRDALNPADKWIITYTYKWCIYFRGKARPLIRSPLIHPLPSFWYIQATHRNPASDSNPSFEKPCFQEVLWVGECFSAIGES